MSQLQAAVERAQADVKAAQEAAAAAAAENKRLSAAQLAASQQQSASSSAASSAGSTPAGAATADTTAAAAAVSRVEEALRSELAQVPVVSPPFVRSARMCFLARGRLRMVCVRAIACSACRLKADAASAPRHR